VLLLVIVLLNGTELRINPHELVSLVTAREADDPEKRYTAEVRCVIQTSNGGEFTSAEECSSIERRLQALKEAR